MTEEKPLEQRILVEEVLSLPRLNPEHRLGMLREALGWVADYAREGQTTNAVLEDEIFALTRMEGMDPSDVQSIVYTALNLTGMEDFIEKRAPYPGKTDGPAYRDDGVQKRKWAAQAVDVFRKNRVGPYTRASANLCGLATRVLLGEADRKELEAEIFKLADETYFPLDITSRAVCTALDLPDEARSELGRLVPGGKYYGHFEAVPADVQSEWVTKVVDAYLEDRGRGPSKEERRRNRRKVSATFAVVCGALSALLGGATAQLALDHFVDSYDPGHQPVIQKVYDTSKGESISPSRSYAYEPDDLAYGACSRFRNAAELADDPDMYSLCLVSDADFLHTEE